MLILRSPKGWTCPRPSTGKPVEEMAPHQVPIADVRQAGPRPQLEDWLSSYRPHELFDGDGRLLSRARRAPPPGERRMGATRMRTAACCCAICCCPTSGTSAWRCRLRGRHASDPRTRRDSGGVMRVNAVHATSASSGPTRPPPTGGGRLRRRPHADGSPQILPTDDHSRPTVG